LEELKVLSAEKGHFEEHWTYPISYPTETQLDELKEIRQHDFGSKSPAPPIMEKMDEHWGVEEHYPQKQEVDQLLRQAKNTNSMSQESKEKQDEIRRHAWE
jgi:hypothetical protein